MKYHLYYGPPASGKSYSIREKIIQDMLNNPGATWLIAEKWVRLGLDNLISHIKDTGRIDQFEYKKSSQEIKCKNGSGCFYVSFNDDNQLKFELMKMKGRIINAIWVDDVYKLSEDEFLTLNIALYGCGDIFVMSTCGSNLDQDGWLKQKFICANRSDVKITYTPCDKTEGFRDESKINRS
jgi:phage terminase large subunit